jgi:hypothetical protein
MISPDSATTVTGSFVFGLATSLHCIGMCGPLACVAAQSGAGCVKLQNALHYQLARIASYTLLGAAAGGLGWLLRPQIARLTELSPLTGIGLAVAILLLLFGLPYVLRSRPQKLLSRIAPGWIGLATPLIPCGPLYFIIGIAALTGSAVRGATLMLVFGLGTLPLLWLAQHQWGRLQALLGARRAQLIQRGVLALATLLVLWRLLPSEIIAGPPCCEPPGP